MRAQAVLPPFPSLSPSVSASSSSHHHHQRSVSPSSSPPLSATAVSELSTITHVHLSNAQMPLSSSSAAYSPSPSLGSVRREAPSGSLSLFGPPLPPSAYSAHGSGVAGGDERSASLSVSGGVVDSAASKAHKCAICALLEALQTTMFTKKKEALDAYQSFVSANHPRFTRSDALLLLYGSPVTPNSTLSSFHSTAAFTRIDRGLLAASGQLSWKNHQLRASATKALGIVAMLLDSRHNADAGVFHQLVTECEYATIRLMKLPKHLSAPSPASSAQGNLHAALRVIDIVKELRPDLIDSLLEEKDAAAAHSSHSHRSPVPPRSSPPTLHISIQHNASAASSPRASRLHDPAPPSPRTPNSPPPLPSSLSEQQHSVNHSSPPYRPPPPLPAHVVNAQLQQQPHPPTTQFSHPPPLSTPSCQSPHSTSAAHAPWLSAYELSSSSATSSAITQPLSACSSPMASKKKQFSSLPAGLQRLNPPSAQPATVTGVAISHGSGSVSGFLSDDWKQRLRSHLSGFFAHRVSREELERAGVLKRSLVFGVPLELLSQAEDADRDSHIPRVLRRCLDVLSAPEVRTLPGLFRISGDSREISEMKVKLDVGEPVDLSAASPHSVAGLLKMWLRELPEPLLTFDMYAPIIATVRTMQQQHQRPSDINDALHALIDQLPPAHRRTLDALLPFLHDVGCCSDVNLMTASNLAICFSPNILRPTIETLESVAKDSPIACAAIAALIQQHQQPDQQHSTGSTINSALQQHQQVMQPASPASPSTPNVIAATSTTTAIDSRPAMPNLPPPIPPSPRSMSQPAAASSTTLHSPSNRSPPPPIPTGLTAALPLRPPPLPIAAGKQQEECKCADGQSEEVLFNV